MAGARGQHDGGRARLRRSGAARRRPWNLAAALDAGAVTRAKGVGPVVRGHPRQLPVPCLRGDRAICAGRAAVAASATRGRRRPVRGRGRRRVRRALHRRGHGLGAAGGRAVPSPAPRDRAWRPDSPRPGPRFDADGAPWRGQRSPRGACATRRSRPMSLPPSPGRRWPPAPSRGEPTGPGTRSLHMRVGNWASALPRTFRRTGRGRAALALSPHNRSRPAGPRALPALGRRQRHSPFWTSHGRETVPDLRSLFPNAAGRDRRRAHHGRAHGHYAAGRPPLAAGGARRAAGRGPSRPPRSRTSSPSPAPGHGPGGGRRADRALGLRRRRAHPRRLHGLPGRAHALRLAPRCREPPSAGAAVRGRAVQPALPIGRARKIVANSLFGDGAAALVGADREPRTHWRLRRTAPAWCPNSADAMTWPVGDEGFGMTLSARVPS